MNYLLIILAILAALIVILLIIAAFSRKEYSVTSEITIQKPGQLVFDYLKLLKNQDNFSKWALMDPNMNKEFRGIDGTVGFVSAWESDKKNVGKGEQEITGIKEGEQIDYEVRFIKPFAGVAQVYLTVDSLSNEVALVTWGFSSKMPYPMNLMLLFMNMEKRIADDLNTGLKNLKKLFEQA
jgi:hypothetical protein